MNKTAFLVGLALILAILYIAYFTDLLKHKNIQVFCRISPASGAMVFYLDKTNSLTSIEVVTTEEARTNKYPHALWHMVAQAAPVPAMTFSYGAAIPGMKPAVSTALPETLQPGVDYSLIVESGNGLKGEKSFSVH